MRQGDRVDDALGIRERVEITGGQFRFVHLPGAESSQVVSGAVVCPSLGDEARRNYRREFLLGRALATRGIPVERFHYRGTGSSQGDPAAVTFHTMVEDAVAAGRRLERETRVRRLAFVGTRWGALVASAAGRRFERPALVLWEPAVDGASFFRELFRVSAIRELSARGGNGSSQALRRLRAEGSMDIRGHEFHLALYDSAAGLSLEEEVSGKAASVLLAQFSAKRSLRPAYARLVERLRGAGVRVDVHFVERREQWWFINPRQETPTGGPWSQRLVDATAAWIGRAAAGLLAPT
jgi:hypothetical protein